MGILTAILSALSAAWTAYRRERELYNNPEMVRAKLAEQTQAAKDAVNKANVILAVGGTPAQHKQALDDLRKAMS